MPKKKTRKAIVFLHTLSIKPFLKPQSLLVVSSLSLQIFEKFLKVPKILVHARKVHSWEFPQGLVQLR